MKQVNQIVWPHNCKYRHVAVLLCSLLPYPFCHGLCRRLSHCHGPTQYGETGWLTISLYIQENNMFAKVWNCSIAVFKNKINLEMCDNSDNNYRNDTRGKHVCKTYIYCNSLYNQKAIFKIWLPCHLSVYALVSIHFNCFVAN